MITIEIRHYENYDPDNCCTGGKYGFRETYTEQPDGTFKVYHETTSVFEYCSRCGTFGHSADECQCKDTFTAYEMLEIIADLNPGAEFNAWREQE